jgi:hypothetical protein
MEKRITENCSKGYENSLINLDPKGELLYVCYDLSICKSCLKPYGQIVRSMEINHDPQSKWYSLNCKCKKEEYEKDGIRNPENKASDIKTSIEFCQCCSMELINFGSKYSSFFCDDCLRLATCYNEIVGKNLIPMGKHSFMNGIMLISPYTKEEARQFKIEIKDFFKRIPLIMEWQKYALFENLYDLGFDLKTDIPISDYDKLVVRLKKDKPKKFNNMVEYLNNQKIN